MTEFLKNKVVIAPDFGFDTECLSFSEKLFPHQKDIVKFCIEGGRRAIFASFGLGKTFMQLEIAKQCILKENRPFLIICPLGVATPQWMEAEKTKSHYLNFKIPPEIKSDLSNTECWIIGRWLADGHIDYRQHQYFISVGNNKMEEFKLKAAGYIGAQNPQNGEMGADDAPQSQRRRHKRAGYTETNAHQNAVPAHRDIGTGNERPDG